MAKPTEIQIAQAKSDLRFTARTPLHIGKWTINKVGKEYVCKAPLMQMTLTKEEAIDFVSTQIANSERKGNTTMKIDELIEKLQALKEEHGNIEVKALDYDGEATEIYDVDFDKYENAICIALPRTSYF